MAISEQIALAAISFLWQELFFAGWLINKNVLVWFLWIIQTSFKKFSWSVTSKPALSFPDQSLLNQRFKYNAVHMPSLNLTPTLSFESRFAGSLLTVLTQKASACSPWIPCLYSTKWQQNTYLIKFSFTDMVFISFAHFNFKEADKGTCKK